MEFSKHISGQLENARLKYSRLMHGLQNNPSDKQLEKAVGAALESVNIFQQLLNPLKNIPITDSKKIYVPRFVILFVLLKGALVF